MPVFRASAARGLRFHQTNNEGAVIDWIQQARHGVDALVINPAGYSFASVTLADALRSFGGPTVELHISNIHARDEAHSHSTVSQAATAVICGAGTYGHVLAVQAAARLFGGLPDPIRLGPSSRVRSGRTRLRRIFQVFILRIRPSRTPEFVKI